MRSRLSATPEIRKLLTLSTGHLPEELLNSLAVGTEIRSSLNEGQEGVVAWNHPYGLMMWVPSDPEDSAASMAVPDEVLKVQIFARSIDCDYVIFDQDGPHLAHLQYWDW